MTVPTVPGSKGRLVFVVPDGLDRPTGGNRYDQALVTALTEQGIELELRTADGTWPAPTPADQTRLGALLTGRAPVLVDGLVACAAPRQVSDAVARGVAVFVLVHMPLALDVGIDPDAARSRNALEGKALRAASGVVATSCWTADDLRCRHGLTEVTVAAPGAVRSPISSGSRTPLLRHLASVSPVKNQLVTVHAVALLAGRRPDLPWTAELTGALDVDPGYTTAVRAAISDRRLGERVRLTGPLTGGELESAWAATDLLLLPSRAETWGLAVTEALARGIPAVVTRGTGADEALGHAPDGARPGAAVDPDPLVLAEAIADLLGPGRTQAEAAALDRRATLSSWDDTALAVRAALAVHPQSGHPQSGRDQVASSRSKKER